MVNVEVGVIEGAVKPTTFKLKLTDRSLGYGSYIKVKHDVYGWVLARIEGMKSYLDDFDEQETLAEGRTVGYRDGMNVMMPKTPFKPQEKVYLADEKLITDVLGLRKKREGSIYVGLLEGHDVPVYLDVGKTVGKHMSVLAKTGAGKSYTVAVVLEELLKTKTSIVVVDPHGEYASLRVENDEYDEMARFNIQVASYSEQLTEYATNHEASPTAKQLTLPANFDVVELTNIMPIGLTDKQKSVLYSALRDLEDEDYTLKDLISRIEEEPTTLKWKVLSGLETLEESGIFNGPPVSYNQLVKSGHASIINLKGTDPHVQQLAVAKLAKDLFHLRSMGKIPELFFLVEEAHNFCPERGFGDAISSEIMRTIASEGRKFGFHLCVVSQRPARIDKNVLSQCATQIILKVTNPNDLKAIGHSIEGFTPGMESEIRQLSVGHALVVGECVEQPITVDIRVRETKHSAAGVVVRKEPGEGGEEKPKKKRKKRPRAEGEGKTTFWTRVKDFFIEPEEED
jgi:DNA helicase HerA-like ATPase